jgi:hypothetical protein
MSKFHEDTGEEVKICTVCQTPFTMPNGMRPKNWGYTKRCPKCRKLGGNKEPADPRKGMYKVEHPILDKFLYG